MSDIPLLERLQLDTKVGMSYCMDMEDLYVEVLEEFVAEDRTEEIKQFFEEKNWERYRISVHSVKSSSLTIGATDLYEIAKMIEEPLKDMDFGPALDLNDMFMEKYQYILDMLRKELGE